MKQALSSDSTTQNFLDENNNLMFTLKTSGSNGNNLLEEMNLFKFNQICILYNSKDQFYLKKSSFDENSMAKEYYQTSWANDSCQKASEQLACVGDQNSFSIFANCFLDKVAENIETLKFLIIAPSPENTSNCKKKTLSKENYIDENCLTAIDAFSKRYQFVCDSDFKKSTCLNASSRAEKYTCYKKEMSTYSPNCKILLKYALNFTLGVIKHEEIKDKLFCDP